MSTGTVYNAEGLTFSKEFRGCSAQTPADSCAQQCRSSARVPWIIRTGAADLPHGWTQIFRADECGSSVRIQFENGENQKANFVHYSAEGSRNTSQGSFELSM